MALHEHSRRSFLALAGGAVLLVACADDGDSQGAAPTTGGPSEPGLGAGRVSSDLYRSDEPQRLAVAIVGPDGQVSGAPARIAMAPEGAEPGPFVDATLHDEGLPEGRGIYVVEPVLDVAGTWEAQVDYDGELLPLAFPVGEEAVAPIPGRPAVSVPTATLDDPLGVDPICTLDPVCPFHDVSLDDVLGQGTPIVVSFSTPARCQTQYCGPTLETLVEIEPEVGADVTTIHVEIYPDLRSQEVVAAVGPEGWGLPSEPWMYSIAGDGSIVRRMDGAFGASEMRAMYEELRAA